MDQQVLLTFVRDLLTAMDIHIEDISIQHTNPSPAAATHTARTVVAVRSDDSKNIIGQDGETLRALNLVAKKIIETKHGADAAHFLIDVNGFHEDKLEVVRSQARMLAQRVRLFKHDVELEPMTAYERLVIHELFADDAEIATESSGEGKFRRIVLKYVDKKKV